MKDLILPLKPEMTNVYSPKSREREIKKERKKIRKKKGRKKKRGKKEKKVSQAKKFILKTT